MEQIKKFLRSRGFTLALLACLVAAAAAGVWAVRTVRDELKKSYDDLTTPQEEPAPEPQLTLDPQEDDVWQQPSDRRRRICGKCTQARILCVLFWGAVWLWFGARTLRTAGRILACQQFSCACLHAARLGQGLERLQRR